MATKQLETRQAADIRSARPAVFKPWHLRAVLRRFASILVLVLLDMAGLALGLYIALILRAVYRGDHPILWGLPWKAEEKWLPFLLVVTVLVFWRAGLYASREQRAGVGRVVASLLLVLVITLAFAVGTDYQHGTYGLYPTAFLMTTICIVVFRASYDVVTRDVLRVLGARRRAVLVGEGEHLLDLRRTLGFGRGGIDYEFVGVVTSSPDGVPHDVLGDLSELPRVLEERAIDELIVTGSDYEESQLLDMVEHAHRRGVQVRIAPTTTELLVQRAEYVPGQGVPLFELRPPAFAGMDWLVKRSFDLVVSTLILLLGLPLWLVIAVAIKLDSRGPVLYRDRRVGLGEQEFAMLKFRSMLDDAAERQPALEEENEASGALFKIRDDPRVTRVGRLLRRVSLDEMPQVLNVLRGDMSLVGPRPLPVRDFLKLEDWHRKRYLVLPGMTGLWQVSGRIALSFDDLVRLDFYYLENWSVWLDISILAKTVPAVLGGKGAY